MADPQVNFFKSTLVGTYSDTDTSLTVATGDGALLPDPSTDGAFNLTIFEGLQVTGSTEFEIVRVTARSGDVLTVTRGAESTTPLTIGSATHSILMSATKKTFDDINDAIANVDLTTLTGVEELTFDSTGDEEFGLPAGTTAQRPSSPSAGYMRFNTDTKKLEIHTGGMWGLVSLDNVIEMQTAELSVTANDAVAENTPIEVEYLVIAGGGGGASGGGGAGGYRSSVSGESSGGGASAESALELDLSTNYTVTVGAGGNGGTGSTSGTQAVAGSNSVFSTITSTGGGRAGIADSSGFGGGSGGGGGANGSGTTTGGSGTTDQGYSGGGNGGQTPDPYPSGGGGGASGAGESAQSSTVSGDGGVGISSDITGSSVGRGGGGGGGVFFAAATPGAATDGGGAGNTSTANGVSGTNNTGGGGGGSGDGGNGGNGGSGVVILRYPSSFTITIGAGLTGTETTVGANKVATITAGTGNVSWT